MAQITISDTLFDELAKSAASMDLSIGELIEPILTEIAQSASGSGGKSSRLSHDEWKTWFEDWQTQVRARSGKYPPGFRADTSRESIYEEC